MDKFKLLYRKITSNPMGFALLSNIITLILGVILSHPFFEENDDLGMSLIVEGAYGSRDWHMLYTNVILAKFTVFMGKIFPSVRWHVVLQVVFVFIAFVAITFILSHYKYGRMLSVILELTLFYELYTSIQFTKTSSFIACVGALIYMHHLGYVYGDIKKSRYEFRRGTIITLMIVGTLLLLYAVMLRNHGYLLGVIPAAVTGGIILLCTLRNGGFKKILAYVGAAVITILFFAVLTTIDRGVYKNDPDWGFYIAFENSRAGVIDYRPDSLDYGRNGEALSEMGVSSNDAYMYVTWQIGDESVATPELFDEISRAAGPKKIDVEFLKAFIASMYDDVLIFTPVVIALCLLAFLLLSRAEMFTGVFWYVAGQVAMIVIGLVSMHYIGRWTHRLVYALLLAVVVSLAYGVALFNQEIYLRRGSDGVREKSGLSSALYITVGILAVAAFTQRLGNEFDYQEHLRSTTDFGVLQMYMQEEKDNLFVLDAFTVQDQYRYDVFNAIEQGALSNVVSSGSWMTRTPIEHAVLAEYGYSDAFDALKKGGDSQVILVDNFFPERKAGYISDHGSGPRYAAEYIETVCGYKLYHIK